MVNANMSYGLTVYGNGGMNTDYPGGQIPAQSACQLFNPGQASYNLLCGSGRLGVDLTQLIVAPSLAYQFAPGHSVGIAPLFAYQRFKAEGLQAFDNPGFSTAPGNVTNRGYANSTGFGARVGYYGRLSPQFAVGVSYATKMSMGEFDKYKGLFAEAGGFDIPSHWGVGIAFEPTPQLQVALDYERINYSDSKSVSNASSLVLMCGAGVPRHAWELRAARASAGATSTCGSWASSTRSTRASRCAPDTTWSDNPIKPEDVTFNILAPGVVRQHITVGATWNQGPDSAITLAGMYAFNNDVTAPSLFNAFSPGLAMQEKIQMHEYSVGVQYARRF